MIEFAKRTVLRHSDLNGIEVSVTYTYCDKKASKKTLRFSFSEKAKKMICGDSDYAVVGIDKKKPNRIYFCQSNSKDGYTITKHGDSSRYHSIFGGKLSYIEPASFVGYYSLQYDATERALYIDRNHKKQEANN